jgi:hypothetical protein
MDLLVETLIYRDTAQTAKHWTEMLSNDQLFKAAYPQHGKYWKRVAAELQAFGGNTIVNLFRGTGACYHEIACDVAKHMGQPLTRCGHCSAQLSTRWHGPRRGRPTA